MKTKGSVQEQLREIKVNLVVILSVSLAIFGGGIALFNAGVL
jgi:hypothetical protein